MGDTFRKFKVNSSSSTGGIQKPKIGNSGGGMGTLMAYMLAQQQNQQLAQGGVGDVANQVKDQFGGEAPVDTKLTVGKNDSAIVPLNRKLDSSERKEVAGAKKYGQAKNSIVSLIKNKTLDSKNGLFGTGMFPDADRTVRQMAVQQKSPLATFYDGKLQDLQSKIKELKATMFDMGGSNLSGGEREILEAPFIMEGKSDQQILEDIGRADQLVQEKAKLVIGGANAASISGVNNGTGDTAGQGQEDRGSKLERIKQRFLEKNP